jgi:hypothetical protein
VSSNSFTAAGINILDVFVVTEQARVTHWALQALCLGPTKEWKGEKNKNREMKT